jgi:hypothetical protein
MFYTHFWSYLNKYSNIPELEFFFSPVQGNVLLQSLSAALDQQLDGLASSIVMAIFRESLIWCIL